uniref:Uncharacterized protein n=1 Tax=Anguilla anguilla TaxID=7936 RepID=A0A0E9TPT8_ANGAN
MSSIANYIEWIITVFLNLIHFILETHGSSLNAPTGFHCVELFLLTGLHCKVLSPKSSVFTG